VQTVKEWITRRLPNLPRVQVDVNALKVLRSKDNSDTYPRSYSLQALTEKY